MMVIRMDYEGGNIIENKIIICVWGFWYLNFDNFNIEEYNSF